MKMTQAQFDELVLWYLVNKQVFDNISKLFEEHRNSYPEQPTSCTLDEYYEYVDKQEKYKSKFEKLFTLLDDASANLKLQGKVLAEAIPEYNIWFRSGDDVVSKIYHYDEFGNHRDKILTKKWGEL